MVTLDYIVIGVVVSYIALMVVMRKHLLDACLGDDDRMQMIEAVGMMGLFLAPTVIFLDLSGIFGELDDIFAMVKWMITTAVGGKAVKEAARIVKPKPKEEDRFDDDQ